MPIEVMEQASEALKRPWQFGVAVGRAYELLRADVREHLKLTKERIGFRYCRFHGLFHDDMLVALRDPAGKLHFQWKQVDEVFDFLLSIGMKPFVELGPMPGALASGPTTFFWWRTNVTPPRDWDEWEALVEAFARHCVRRYGVEEVRSWYFEVWNEPNLRAFWAGTWEEYLELYARAARALKRVDPGLQVGGPSSAEARRVPEFLSDCREKRLSVDFVSTHVYPQNEWNHFPTESPHPPGEFFGETLRRVRKEAGETPLFWTEWNALSARTPADVEWTDNPSIDALEAAGFLVRACVELDGESEGMFWWVASDVFEEAGIAQSPFSCTYGLVTVDGIPKASFRAFELLAAMRGERVFLSSEGGRGVLICRDGEVVRVLGWNDASVDSPSPWREELRVPFPVTALVALKEVRKGKGSAYEAWVEAGKPHELTPLQREALMAASMPWFQLSKREPADGHLDLLVELGPGEVGLWEISPAPPQAHNRDFYSEEVAGWNAALGEKGS